MTTPDSLITCPPLGPEVSFDALSGTLTFTDNDGSMHSIVLSDVVGENALEAMRPELPSRGAALLSAKQVGQVLAVGHAYRERVVLGYCEWL